MRAKVAFLLGLSLTPLFSLPSNESRSNNLHNAIKGLCYQMLYYEEVGCKMPKMARRILCRQLVLGLSIGAPMQGWLLKVNRTPRNPLRY